MLGRVACVGLTAHDGAHTSQSWSNFSFYVELVRDGGCILHPGPAHDASRASALADSAAVCVSREMGETGDCVEIEAKEKLDTFAPGPTCRNSYIVSESWRRTARSQGPRRSSAPSFTQGSTLFSDRQTDIFWTPLPKTRAGAAT